MKMNQRVVSYFQTKKRWSGSTSADENEPTSLIISSDEKETKSGSKSADKKMSRRMSSYLQRKKR